MQLQNYAAGHVVALIPGPEADTYLAELAAQGLTPRDRETACTFLASRKP